MGDEGLEESNLDFTSTIVKHAGDLAREQPVEHIDPMAKVMRQADSLLDALALKVELGTRDTRLWHLLAGMYLGTDRLNEYNDVAARYVQTFGQALRLLPDSATVFTLPVKINQESIPSPESVAIACTSPGGAIVDFSEVRRMSTGGLIALTAFFNAFVDKQPMPSLRASDAFMASVERAAMGEHANREMWEMLLAYKRFTRDRKGYEDLSVRYSARFDNKAA